MLTVVDSLRTQSRSIAAQLQDLLLTHSSIYEWNVDTDAVLVISTRGDFAYKELDTEGRQMQTKVADHYNKYFQVIQTLLSRSPTETGSELQKSDELIRSTIKHDMTWFRTTTEAYDECSKRARENNWYN